MDTEDSLDIVTPVSPQAFINEIDYNELEILDTVGHGAFGLVQQALWRGRIVAVKTIDSVDGGKEFRDEVQNLSSVRHKNIIRLFGTSVNKPKVCLIMEYAECGSLYNLLHPADPKEEPIEYTFAHVMSWSLQCAEAVAYLHSVKPKPIVHRDLKPPNMLLTNQGISLKICDFGTAREESSVMSSNKGSASWMAPEVFEGTRYTIKCDVYSFGIVLWEMLTRKKPFEEIGPPAFRIMWAVHNGTRPPPIQGIPMCLEDLMNSCWVKEQERRPAFADIVKFFRIVNELITGGDKPIFEATIGDVQDSVPCNWYESSEQKTSIPLNDHDSEGKQVHDSEGKHPEDTNQRFSPVCCNEGGEEMRVNVLGNLPDMPQYPGPEISNPLNFGAQPSVSIHGRTNSDPDSTGYLWHNGFRQYSHHDQLRMQIRPPYQPFVHPPFIVRPYSQYPTDPIDSLPQRPRFPPPVSPTISEEEISTETQQRRRIITEILGGTRLRSEVDNVSQWRLVPPDLIPVNPVDYDQASIQMYENYMEALKKYISIQEKIEYLRQRKEVIEKSIEEEDREQKRNSCFIADYIKLQDERRSLLNLHGSLKTQLARAEGRALETRKNSY